MLKTRCRSASKFSQVSIFPLGIILILLLSTTLCLGADKSVIPDKNSSIEAKMTVIDTGKQMVKQSQIDEWKMILDRLCAKCSRDSRDRVASLVLTSRKLLQDRGKKLSLKETARLLDESLPAEGSNLLDCQTMFSSTITREATGMARLKLDKAPY